MNSSTNGNGHAASGAAQKKAAGSKKPKGFQKGNKHAFAKGKSGNPTGGSERQKQNRIFGEWLRNTWLERLITVAQSDGSTKKVRRLDDVLERLANHKPDVLLHYAYGKPVEMIQLTDAEGGPVEFAIKVSGKEMP